MAEAQRVQKLIANAGVCSRRKAEELIEKGIVTVNGARAKLGDCATEQDDIRVQGKPLPRERTVYLLFHKPVGVVTALSDAHERTIMEYIHVKERVFPVGRLDKDTSGLLLLTNDGELANRISHPRYETKKTYLAQLDRPIRASELQRLERGLPLEDGMTSPCSATQRAPDVVELQIHEGRNRIVRRMFEHLGYEVVRLQRIRIGALALGDLAPGQYDIVPKIVAELALR